MSWGPCLSPQKGYWHRVGSLHGARALLVADVSGTSASMGATHLTVCHQPTSISPFKPQICALLSSSAGQHFLSEHWKIRLCALGQRTKNAKEL